MIGGPGKFWEEYIKNPCTYSNSSESEPLTFEKLKATFDKLRQPPKTEVDLLLERIALRIRVAGQILVSDAEEIVAVLCEAEDMLREGE